MTRPSEKRLQLFRRECPVQPRRCRLAWTRGNPYQNLCDFIDKGLTAHHDVVEYLDNPLLKVFHGKVRMKFDAPAW
jgi:hypothetical protein